MTVAIAKSIFALAVAVWLAIRHPHQRRSRRTPVRSNLSDRREATLLWIAATGLSIIPLVYVATGFPRAEDHRFVPALGWLGTLVFLAALWLSYRAHHDLGRNFSSSLKVREGHSLVTAGVYRHVRHPIYASFWLWGVAQALLLPNWLAGSAGLIGFGVLFFGRVAREERDAGDLRRGLSRLYGAHRPRRAGTLLMTAQANRRPRICVIGAGPCGLTALKNLLAAGLDDVVCHEESATVGGNWVFDEEPDRTSVYDSTHIISSKSMSEFEDYPMPRHYPDFPSHRQIRAYFEDYAAHFRLLSPIRLRSRVNQASLRPDGRWSVAAAGPCGSSEEVFDDLVVATGHHRDPYIPQYPGRFTGEILHSREFKRPDPFRNKRVLVVGAGNSACDIAVDVARVGEKTCLSVRRGCYILPKLVMGRPVDVAYRRVRRRVPHLLLQPFLEAFVRFLVGRWESYGLPRPQGRLFETHLTLNSNLLPALRDGAVLARAGIDRFDGSLVHFCDGTVEAFDTIIWGTGFRTSFPFLDRSVLDWETSHPPPLYLKMMHRRIANLFFIGLFQPIGCIWRLADPQARIAALQIAGRLERPRDIDARIDREMRSPHWRFERSARHAVEVDYHDFRRELMRELARAHI